MKIIKTNLKDVHLVETTPFLDSRGEFVRWFCKSELQSIIGERSIVQINYSFTKKTGTIRGMHFQYPPYAEMKLVRCVRGHIWDVVIDLRKNSPTFLQWIVEELSEEDGNMIVIPEGCAHGFQTLSENCKMLYLHTEFYHPESVGCVSYKDPRFGIPWPHPVTEISIPDENQQFLDDSFSGDQA